MAIFEIEGPDGLPYEIEAPDDATPEQIKQVAIQNLSAMSDEPANPNWSQTLKNVSMLGVKAFDGATLGALPYAQTAIATPLVKAGSELKSMVTGQPAAGWGDIWNEGMAFNRGERKAAEEQFPVASTAAELTGALGSGILTGGTATMKNLMSAPTMMGRALKTAPVAGAAGFASGALNNEGDVGEKLAAGAGTGILSMLMSPLATAGGEKLVQGIGTVANKAIGAGKKYLPKEAEVVMNKLKDMLPEAKKSFGEKEGNIRVSQGDKLQDQKLQSFESSALKGGKGDTAQRIAEDFRTGQQEDIRQKFSVLHGEATEAEKPFLEQANELVKQFPQSKPLGKKSTTSFKEGDIPTTEFKDMAEFEREISRLEGQLRLGNFEGLKGGKPQLESQIKQMKRLVERMGGSKVNSPEEAVMSVLGGVQSAAKDAKSNVHELYTSAKKGVKTTKQEIRRFDVGSDDDPADVIANFSKMTEKAEALPKNAKLMNPKQAAKVWGEDTAKKYQIYQTPDEEVFFVGAAKEVNEKLRISNDAMTKFVKNARRNIKEDFDPRNHTRLNTLLDDLETKLSTSRTPGQSINELEKWRKSVTNTAQDLKGNPEKKTEAMLTGKLRGLYDAHMDRLGEDAIISGDKASIEAFKAARNARKEFGKTFESNDVVKRIVESERETPLTVREATQLVFGADQITGKKESVKTIKALMKATGDEAGTKSKFKQGILLKVLKEAESPQEIDAKGVPLISPAKLNSNLKQLLEDKELLNTLFDEKGIADLTELQKTINLISSKKPGSVNASNTFEKLAQLYQGLSGIPILSVLPKATDIALKEPMNARKLEKLLAQTSEELEKKLNTTTFATNVGTGYAIGMGVNSLLNGGGN